jgi:hypothetical protein
VLGEQPHGGRTHGDGRRQVILEARPFGVEGWRGQQALAVRGNQLCEGGVAGRRILVQQGRQVADPCVCEVETVHLV